MKAAAVAIDNGKPRKKYVVGKPASFEFITKEQASDVLFGSPKGRHSAYLGALQELIKRGPSFVLRVESITARAQFSSQAKKHGIKILFGEKDGKLFVRVEGVDTPESMVIDFIKAKPRSADEIRKFLISRGSLVLHADVIQTLSGNNKILLSTIDGVKKWTVPGGAK